MDGKMAGVRIPAEPGSGDSETGGCDVSLWAPPRLDVCSDVRGRDLPGT